MKLLCRWFGHKPVDRLLDVMTYAFLAAHAARKGLAEPPHTVRVCARCGVRLEAL